MATKKKTKKKVTKKKAAKKKTGKKTTKKKATKKKATKKKATKKKATKKKATSAEAARMEGFKRTYEAIYGKGYFNPSTVKCPLCRGGVIVPKKGRFGPVWVCDADVRPRCKFVMDTKPTGKTCSFKRSGKRCGALIESGTKTIRNRCSDKTCPNRNPHKL